MEASDELLKQMSSIISDYASATGRTYRKKNISKIYFSKQDQTKFLRDESPDAFTTVIEHYMDTTNYNELGKEDQQFVIDMNKYYKSLLEKGDEMVARELQEQANAEAVELERLERLKRQQALKRLKEQKLHQLQTDLEKNKQLLIDIGNAIEREVAGVGYDKQYRLIQMQKKTKQNIAEIEREIGNLSARGDVGGGKRRRKRRKTKRKTTQRTKKRCKKQRNKRSKKQRNKQRKKLSSRR